jgi:hypothetical protein
MAEDTSRHDIVLTSPNGKFQITLELRDDGKLLALLSLKQPDGTYKPQHTEKLIAHAKEQSAIKDSWYLA